MRDKAIELACYTSLSESEVLTSTPTIIFLDYIYFSK